MAQSDILRPPFSQFVSDLASVRPCKEKHCPPGEILERQPGLLKPGLQKKSLTLKSQQVLETQVNVGENAQKQIVTF